MRTLGRSHAQGSGQAEQYARALPVGGCPVWQCLSLWLYRFLKELPPAHASRPPAWLRRQSARACTGRYGPCSWSRPRAEGYRFFKDTSVFVVIGLGGIGPRTPSTSHNYERKRLIVDTLRRTGISPAVNERSGAACSTMQAMTAKLCLL